MADELGAPRDVVTQARLRVAGMTCAGCVQRVESALTAVQGVQTVSVNVLVGMAEVQFDAGQTDAVALAKAVTAGGYVATVDAPETQSAAERDLLEVQRTGRALRQRLGVAWTLLVGVATMIGSLPLMHTSGEHAAALAGDPLAAWLMLLDAPARQMVPWLYAWPIATLQWALLLLCATVVVGPARGFFVRAWHAAQQRSADMNTLVAVGTATAFGVSAVATVAPDVLSTQGLPLQVWFDAVPWVPGFVLLGRLLEDSAKRTARAGLDALVALQPATALVLRQGKPVQTPLAQIVVADLVQVPAGAAIAVDGTVTEGASGVDESQMTGESVPVRRSVGDRVLAGTVACDGALVVRATAIGQDAALQQIARQVEAAMLAKPALQKMADRLAGVFAPFVLVSALIAGVLWALLGPNPGLGDALVIATSVVIVACPCAMGLAVPMAVWVATGRAARLGLLVRQGTAWERAGRIDTVVFDKTGTLTEGRPQLVAKYWLSAELPEDWGPVATLAGASTHPLSRAIAAVLADSNRPALPVVGLTVAAGFGIGARCAGALWRLGAASWVCQGELAAVAVQAVGDQPGSLVVASRGGKPVAALLLRDTVRPTARQALADLALLGATVYLASGDRAIAVQAIAAELGIAHARADLRPADKLLWLEQLRAEGKRVAMVGDGVNDAPALAAADLAVAIGDGSAVAVGQADLVLLRPDLRVLAQAIQLARATDKVLRQNLAWAFGYNVLAMPLAAGALYPLSHHLPSPMLASAAMALSSVCVVTNSLRLAAWRAPHLGRDPPL